MKYWKSALAAALAATALIAAGCGGGGAASSKAASAAAASAAGKKKIAVVQLVQHGALDAANKGFVDQLAKRGYDDKKVEFDQQNAQGDQSNLRTITNRFKNNKPDLICAIATPAAQSVANEITDIPVVGTAITDYTSAKLVKSDDKPGGNVTGVSDLASIDAQMDMARKILPNMKTVGLMYCSSEVNSEVQANMVKEYCKKNNIAIEERTVNNVNDIQQVAESIRGKCDLIYVPTDNVIASAMPTLIKVTDEAKIPVLAAESNMVKAGAMAALSVDYYRLGQQTGDMAADILDGKSKPADMAIQHQKELTLVVNQKSLEILGVKIPEEIMSKADKV